MNEKVKVEYRLGEETYIFHAVKGSILRDLLLEKGFTPYTKYTQNKNCGGNGICATCGVWLVGEVPAPTHWHDKIAMKHGYPRLSCQIRLNEDIIVEAVEGKVIWGLREMRERKKNS